jgi:uncharacterized glyoxalase superfamily protein PhnB
MHQHLSMVTIGVADVARSRRFYEELGWKSSAFESEDVCFFQMGTGSLALYGRAALAADMGMTDDGAGFRPVTLAWNGRDKAEVDAFIATAIKAGAKLIKPAQDVFWGGYAGYVSDPDGHIWEAAFNPFCPTGDDGALTLP